MKIITAFPNISEYEKMKRLLDGKALSHEVIAPPPCYEHVGCPAIALDQEVRAKLASQPGSDFICAGWVDYYPCVADVPEGKARQFDEDIFGTASIMVLAPCIADPKKLRMIAHVSGDMGQAFPLLNTEMRGACFNREGPLLTFMEGHRMVTLYPRRIAAAKVDDIVDGWRLLESVRCVVNDAYSRRGEIEPSYEMRKKPPALEIYKRLPGTNCRGCGQKTCMAFALTVWSGQCSPGLCTEIFGGRHSHLKEAFLEICAGIGLIDYRDE